MMRVVWVVLFAGLVFGADLAAVKAEQNLEKRSEKALIYAGEVLTAMRAELDRNNVEKIKSQLAEFRSAVELSVESLAATGKNARRHPKHFKRAELRLRDLQRRLETFKRDMSLDDRPMLEDLLTYVGKKVDALVDATLRGK